MKLTSQNVKERDVEEDNLTEIDTELEPVQNNMVYIYIGSGIGVTIVVIILLYVFVFKK